MDALNESSNSSKDLSLHAYVSGKVQGVFFRDSVKKYALELSLCGWVRNLEDGQVEVCVEGAKKDLEELESYLWRGPRLAEVDDVKILYSEKKHNFEDFKIVG